MTGLTGKLSLGGRIGIGLFTLVEIVNLAACSPVHDSIQVGDYVVPNQNTQYLSFSPTLDQFVGSDGYTLDASWMELAETPVCKVLKIADKGRNTLRMKCLPVKDKYFGGNTSYFTNQREGIGWGDPDDFNPATKEEIERYKSLK